MSPGRHDRAVRACERDVGLSLFLSQVLDGLLLPIMLVFVFLLAGKRWVLGSLISGRVLLGLGWLVTVAIGVMCVALVVSGVVG